MTQISIVKELEEKASIGRTTAKNTIRDVKRAMGITATKYPEEVRAKILHFAVSGETPVPMPVNAESSFDEIRDSGYLHLNDAEANAIAFAHDVAALKGKCTKGQGGSDFGKRVNDYWGLSSSQASRLLKIGQNTNFPQFGKLLPKSISALEPLAELTHEQITEAVESGAVHPGMTAKESVAVAKPDAVEDREHVHDLPASEGNEYQIIDGEAVEVSDDHGRKYSADDIENVRGEYYVFIDELFEAIDSIESLLMEHPGIFGKYGKDTLKNISDKWDWLVEVFGTDELDIDRYNSGITLEEANERINKIMKENRK